SRSGRIRRPSLSRLEYRVRLILLCLSFFFSSRRRHTRFKCDWSSDVCSSDLRERLGEGEALLKKLRRLKLRAAAAGKDDRAQLLALMDDIEAIRRKLLRECAQLEEEFRIAAVRRSEERRVGEERRWRGSAGTD